MNTLLCFTLIAGMAAAQPPDSSQIKLLRYELKDFVRQEIAAEQKMLEANTGQQMAAKWQEQQLAFQKLENEVAAMRRDYWIIGGAGLITAIVSIVVSVFQLRRFAVKKAQEMYVKAMERVDATTVELKIPRNDFAVEKKRLQWTGFEKLVEYETLNQSCTHGVVIFPAPNDAEAQKLLNFLEREKVDQEKATFVIYTAGQLNQSLFQDWPNVTLANRPLTLAQAVFVAARGLKK